MKKLLITLLIFSSSVIGFAQEKVYSDDKLDVKFTLDKLSDKVNDRFYEFYSFEVVNNSNENISFTPIYTYKTETGQLRSSATHDGQVLIELAPGESLKGSLSDNKDLTLFKKFLPGNSGKPSANSTYTLESLSIQYQ